MDISIYEFQGYKRYLKAWIRSKPNHGHGEKRKIADYVGCNSAYISQVIEHHAHLSLEQAALLNEHLNHNVLESRFFLLLVQYERAGNQELRSALKLQIDEIIERRLSMQHQISHKEGLGLESQAIYFSSWHYPAVHVLLLVPKFRTKQAISDRLGIPLGKASEILNFLVENGMAKYEGGSYHYGSLEVFVPDSSPLSAKSHINWRMKAISSLDQILPEDLHLSSVAALNAGDVPKIRAIFMKAAAEAQAVIMESEKEDTLIAFNLDLFRV